MRTKPTTIYFVLFLSIYALQAQQTITKTLSHDNVTRTYMVYVPAIYDGNNPVPLMFNFHGYTGQANGQMNTTKMRPVADTGNFILVYPQGTLFNGNTHWSVGSWTRGSTADDLGFTEAMIDTLASAYNIDLNRVYSCGFSNGGYFSFVLACQLSNRIAAIGAVGGKMSAETYNACNPMHPTPVVTIHGTADNVVAYHTAQPVGSKTISELNAYWINYNNTNTTAVVENIPNINTTDGSTVEYYSYRDGDSCISVDHYKVIGGGHDWPGAWGNKDIDASSVIWNFVSQYDMNGLIGCGTTSIHGGGFADNEMRIYPNPTDGLISLKMDVPQGIDCYIYSLAGKLLLSKHIRPGDKSIDVSHLSANIYFLKIGGKMMKLIKM